MSKTRRKLRESLNRDEYWMGLAFMVAAGSRSYRQQGSVIVSPNGELLGMANDGSPRSTMESEHAVHSEMNAIFSAGRSVQGATIYSTHAPCYQCMMAIAAAGLKRVFYFPTKSPDNNTVEVAGAAYCHLEEFRGNLNWMRDHIKSLEAVDIFSQPFTK